MPIFPSVSRECQAARAGPTPRAMLAYDDAMRRDAAWHARISRVLSGALRVWGVPGTVTRDPDDPDGFVIAPNTGLAMRVRHQAPAGWTVTLRDSVSGAQKTPLGRHAGLPGLLRRLREDLAPDAPAGRLVIGAQPLLGRDSGGR